MYKKENKKWGYGEGGGLHVDTVHLLADVTSCSIIIEQL
jgi:hypothetical protein